MQWVQHLRQGERGTYTAVGRRQVLRQHARRGVCQSRQELRVALVAEAVLVQACTHTRTHTHIHTYIHTYTYIHISARVYPSPSVIANTLTHTHSLTHTYSLTHTHSYTFSLTHTHSLSHTHSHTHSLTHSLTHTHTHSHILTHILTHSHTHSHTHCLPVRMAAREGLHCGAVTYALPKEAPRRASDCTCGKRARAAGRRCEKTSSKPASSMSSSTTLGLGGE